MGNARYQLGPGSKQLTGIRIVLCAGAALVALALYWEIYRAWTFPHELGHYLAALFLGRRPEWIAWNNVIFWGAGPFVTWLITFAGPVCGILFPISLGEIFNQQRIPEIAAFLWGGALKNFMVDLKSTDMIGLGYYGVILYVIVGGVLLFLGAMLILWSFIPQQERWRILHV